jgi:hypothetical protein
MSTVITIYRQTYRHRDREFTVWSFLSSFDPESSSLLFAFQSEGETVEGLADRAEAIRKARERIDELPANPVEETPSANPPQARQGHPPQQAELALG